MAVVPHPAAILTVIAGAWLGFVAHERIVSYLALRHHVLLDPPFLGRHRSAEFPRARTLGERFPDARLPALPVRLAITVASTIAWAGAMALVMWGAVRADAGRPSVVGATLLGVVVFWLIFGVAVLSPLLWAALELIGKAAGLALVLLLSGIERAMCIGHRPPKRHRAPRLRRRSRR